MTTKTFAELGLSDELLKAIDKLGFEQPSSIQAAASASSAIQRVVVTRSQPIR
jgi:superfamily II DNA/RNA helicase